MGAQHADAAAGEHTKAHRHTGSFIYQVAKGHGHSVIAGQPLRLEGDATSFACRPGPGTSTPTARAADDACLFSFNDLPVMKALGLYREAGLSRQRRSSERRQPGPRCNFMRLITYRASS